MHFNFLYLAKYRNIFIGLVLLSISSCSHHFYSPNDPTFIGLEEKGDVHVNLGAPSSFQVGCSPIKHLGLSVNYFRQSSNLDDETNQTNLHQTQGEIFTHYIGAYYLFKNKNTFPDIEPFYRGLLIDSYLGHGIGSIDNIYPNKARAELKIEQVTWQIGAQLKLKNYDLGLIYKLAKVNYHSPSLLGPITEDDFNEIEKLLDNNPFLNHEVSIRMAAGLRGIKVYTSATYLLNNHSILSSPSRIVTLGITFDIDHMFKKINL